MYVSTSCRLVDETADGMTRTSPMSIGLGLLPPANAPIVIPPGVVWVVPAVPLPS